MRELRKSASIPLRTRPPKVDLPIYHGRPPQISSRAFMLQAKLRMKIGHANEFGFPLWCRALCRNLCLYSLGTHAVLTRYSLGVSFFRTLRGSFLAVCVEAYHNDETDYTMTNLYWNLETEMREDDSHARK